MKIVTKHYKIACCDFGRLFACGLASVVFMNSVAIADVIVVGKPTKPTTRQASAAVAVDDAANGLPKRPDNKRTLRCWQNGQLIVERRVELPPEDANRIVRIGSAEKIEAQLFDLRNSTCLLQ